VHAEESQRTDVPCPRTVDSVMMKNTVVRMMMMMMMRRRRTVVEERQRQELELSSFSLLLWLLLSRSS